VTFDIVDRILIDKILIGGWAFLADLAGRVFRFSRLATSSATWPCLSSGWPAWCGSRPGPPPRTRFA
jgi:hypothetical protein